MYKAPILIECRQLDDSLKTPIQIGMLGIKCDPLGKVISVNRDSDAFGKIKTGDILTEIAGRKAGTKRARRQLYERYVEPVNAAGKKIRVTVLRNGTESEIEIIKSLTTIGYILTDIEHSLRTVEFNVDKGIIHSDLIKAKYSLTYHFPEALSFTDDYTGDEPLKRLTKNKIPPRIYDYEWKLLLK